MEDGLEVFAKQFIDCTYDGDLMARAGVEYAVGREANAQYGETFNGIRKLGTGGHEWPKKHPVDPYVVKGESSERVAASRLCRLWQARRSRSLDSSFLLSHELVKDADRLPFRSLTFYDEQQYELLARLFETGEDPRPSLQY